MTTLPKIGRRAALILGLAPLALTLAGTAPALAQDKFPSKDITIIVPYAPGASGDILARAYAEGLAKVLDTTVVVQNAAGGSGTIGTVKLMGAKPDGYTLGYGHNSPLAIQPHRNAELPFKSIDDFTAIGGIGHQAGTISVNSKSDWKTLDDLVAAAKEKPGEVSIAVGAAGNVKDLQLRQFEKAAGVDFNITPFSGGGAEAVAAALGQIVDAVSVNASSVAGQIASDNLRPLAIFADSDAEEFHGFKVISPKQYPGMLVLQDSSGIIAPKGLPEDVLATLEAAHQKVLAEPDFQAMLDADGYIADPANSAEFRDEMLTDLKNFGEILKE